MNLSAGLDFLHGALRKGFPGSAKASYPATSEYRVEFLTRLDEVIDCLEQMRAAHRQGEFEDYYLSPDWLLFLFRRRPALFGQAVCARLESAGGTAALWPLFLERRTYRGIPLARLTLAGNVYAPVRGAICSSVPTARIAEHLARAILRDCPVKWNILEFREIEYAGSAEAAVVQRLQAAGARVLIRGSEPHFTLHCNPELSTPGFFSQFSGNLRSQIRRGLRRLYERYDVQVALFTQPGAELKQALDDYRNIYAASWKAPEQDPEFHAELALETAGRNQLRLFVLYAKATGSRDTRQIDDRLEIVPLLNRRPASDFVPVATYYFIKYGHTAWFLKSAYDPAFSNCSAGSVLFWWTINHLRKADACTGIDFQKGGEEYKKRWARPQPDRRTLWLSNPGSFKGDTVVAFAQARRKLRQIAGMLPVR